MIIASNPHHIYSEKKTSTVYIVQHGNKFQCLENAVKESHFFKHLNEKQETSGKDRGEFHIAIKPNFMCAANQTDISIFTDPELVEHLIKMIRDHGYKHISVVESQMVWTLVCPEHVVPKVADMLGYTREGYEIVDLTKEMEEASDPEQAKCSYDGELLGDDYVGPTWEKADYHISFAKNKTHFQCYYTGCLKNIYGCLPQKDKWLEYHIGPSEHRRDFDAAAIAILEKFDVDFAFLDAFISSDGITGVFRDGSPNVTQTIICGENCLAVDWVQGIKMGLDPLKNYVVRRAVKRWGTPDVTVKKKLHNDPIKEVDLDTLKKQKWDPWENVNPIVIMGCKLFGKRYNLFCRFISIFSYRLEMVPGFHVKKRSWFCETSKTCIKWLDEHTSILYPLLIIITTLLILALLVVSGFGVYKLVNIIHLPPPLAVPNPLKYGTALLIVIGGLMHLGGLITAVRHRKWKSLCWISRIFFILAPIVYPVSAVMIIKNISWGYWISLILPCVGGLVIFLGFVIKPWACLLTAMAGTFGREITGMGFVQITSESLAVACSALVLLCSWNILCMTG